MTQLLAAPSSQALRRDRAEVRSPPIRRPSDRPACQQAGAGLVSLQGRQHRDYRRHGRRAR